MKLLNEINVDLTIEIKALITCDITNRLKELSQKNGKYFDLCWYSHLPQAKLNRLNITRYKIVEMDNHYLILLYTNQGNLIGQPEIEYSVKKLDAMTYHEYLIRKR